MNIDKKILNNVIIKYYEIYSFQECRDGSVLEYLLI